MPIVIDPCFPDTVDDLIKAIDKLQGDLKKKCGEVVKRLIDIGYDVASSEYAAAPYAGTFDIVVTKTAVTELSPGVYQGEVHANGTAVLFVEFGTGIVNSVAPAAEYEMVDTAILPHGSYGQGKGASGKPWIYNGTFSAAHAPAGTTDFGGGRVRTYGNDATPAMYEARKRIEDDFDRVVKEVFGI